LDTTWLNLVQLCTLADFANITQQIRNNDRQWKLWFDEAEPESCPIPDGYDSLATFPKLLLIRSFCPDRTTAQARSYIAQSLGERYTESVVTELEAVWQESSPIVPMICFLSLGSDPTDAIMGMAKKKKIDCKDISMGECERHNLVQREISVILPQYRKG
jgi:dynein heavy chain